MIVFVRGTLFEKNPTTVWVDVQGMGYEVMISLNTYDRLPAVGEPCLLYTSHVVRDDGHLLFGFFERDEKATFELLITVNGVGPKVALTILNGLSPTDLHAAIAEGDVKRLKSVHGVGKKTAERLIVELRDKIDPAKAFAAKLITTAGGDSAALRDTVLALTQLGFSQESARLKVQAALDAGCDTSNTEALLKKALATR